MMPTEDNSGVRWHQSTGVELGLMVGLIILFACAGTSVIRVVDAWVSKESCCSCMGGE